MKLNGKQITSLLLSTLLLGAPLSANAEAVLNPDGTVTYYPCEVEEQRTVGNFLCDVLEDVYIAVSLTDTSLTSVTVPESVDIAGISFADCQNLTEILTNNSVFQSRDGVLYSSSSLMNYPPAKECELYRIPEGTFDSYGHTFDGCTNLKTVIFPSSMKRIYEKFNDCSALENIVDYSDTYSESALASLKDRNITVYGEPDGETAANCVKQDVSFHALGDTDSDGDVDILDVLTLNKNLLGLEVLPDRLSADVNNDGIADSTDSLKILKYLVKLSPSFSDTLAASGESAAPFYGYRQYARQSGSYTAQSATVLTSVEERNAAGFPGWQTYNENYFAEKDLILVQHPASSGSFWYDVEGITVDSDNNWTVHLTEYQPEIYTDDMCYWAFAIETEKSAETAASVQVEVTPQQVGGDVPEPTEPNQADNAAPEFYGFTEHSNTIGEDIPPAPQVLTSMEEVNAAGVDFAGYSAEFFETNDLILVQYDAGSGSFTYTVDGITADSDNNWTVHLTQYQPLECTDDMRYWSFLIATNKAAENAASIQVEVTACQTNTPF